MKLKPIKSQICKRNDIITIVNYRVKLWIQINISCIYKLWEQICKDINENKK